MRKWLALGILGGCSGHLVTIIVVPLLIVIIVVSAVHPSSQAPKKTASPDITQITHERMGEKNMAVVDAATELAATLYACGPSPQHYLCYTSAFPSTVQQYLLASCGGCDYARSGAFQCVFFVLAAYYLANQPLPEGPNAVDFWLAYANQPGYEESGPSSLPIPGDIMVFAGPPDNPAGHVAIVIDVKEPSSTQAGYIQVAQANGLQPIDSLPLLSPTLDVYQAQIGSTSEFAGNQLLGYIRYTAGLHS